MKNVCPWQLVQEYEALVDLLDSRWRKRASGRIITANPAAITEGGFEADVRSGFFRLHNVGGVVIQLASEAGLPERVGSVIQSTEIDRMAVDNIIGVVCAAAELGVGLVPMFHEYPTGYDAGMLTRSDIVMNPPSLILPSHMTAKDTSFQIR